ncbi:MAG: AAA family ATPase [Phycisphaeraceae bacterium]
MLESIQFKNFKCLRDTTLKLGRFTLIVGPNGSGKSTALEGIRVSFQNNPSFDSASASARDDERAVVEITTNWAMPESGWRWSRMVTRGGGLQNSFERNSVPGSSAVLNQIQSILAKFQVFAFDPRDLARPSQLEPQLRLESSGSNLANILDSIRDRVPENFEALNAELARWLPEFDRVLFQTPEPGKRAVLLRTKTGHHAISAEHLSQGTLLALAMLTLAYLPDPPPIIAIEEPERGIHPRLLRDVKDALYRLAHPDPAVSDRKPVQVIATTHSPYMLDLFRDHPEDIVIAEKLDDEAKFHSLVETEHYHEIVSGAAPLGELWYSGVLGGVPQNR